VRFRNSIVAGNVDNTGLAPDCTVSTITSQQYNLIGSNTGCSFPVNTGDQLGVSAQLGPLASNRGPTQTHALLTGSPALEVANPGVPGSGGFTCEARDQRGYIRPWDAEDPPVPPAVCDKGAFELCVPKYDDMTTSFAAPFAKDLTCRGITTGCGTNLFCPTNPVTRLQMAVFLVTSMGEQASGVKDDTYFDDLLGNAAAGFPNRLYELNVAGGCGTRLYCPNSPVTREQAAVFIVVALEEKPSTTPTDYFNDIASSPYRQYINRLFELNIAGGCGNGSYCPTSNVTRDTMSVWMSVAFFGY